MLHLNLRGGWLLSYLKPMLIFPWVSLFKSTSGWLIGSSSFVVEDLLIVIWSSVSVSVRLLVTLIILSKYYTQDAMLLYFVHLPQFCSICRILSA
jgi:hypothetical protein